ncbi:acyl--CoA ligase [Kitasatospora sp. NBC_01250]|uniref:class I adenylate-forming enzyme family protein n=1 Tax=Kitasatospora sp. NBC_01250 TaxID=2903571 RepID=UPI002E34CE9F|nr:class I adenylate-forming enzyme family protein [Kitasatospora sp. NBC_01250]
MRRGTGVQSISERLSELAAETPDRPAITELAAGGTYREITYRRLFEDVSALAGLFDSWNRDMDGDAVICHPASVSIESAKTILAALCAGVTVLPHAPLIDAEVLSSALSRAGLSGHLRSVRMPGAPETDQGPGATVRMTRWEHPAEGRRPHYLLATSGSTGIPKLVPFRNFGGYDPRAVPDVVFRTCKWQSGQKQLIVLPIYHIGTVAALIQGVLDRNQLFLANQLDPEEMLDAIADRRIEWLMLTPNYLRHLLPAAARRPERLNSLNGLLHTALPCPAPLKQAWLDLLGGERVFEMYGGTEGVGVTVISGSEWLAKPGSVGRGLLTDIRIGDAQGLERGEDGIGQIYLRRFGASARTHAATPWLRSTSDGFVSLGDMGWVDEDGYLYVFDRAANQTATASGVAWLGRLSLVLRTHPDILDAECIALTDDGQVDVGMLLVTRDPRAVPDLAELERFCATQAGGHRFPRIHLQVAEIPRSEIGKPDATAIRAIFSSAGSRETRTPVTSPFEEEVPRGSTA